MPGQPQANEKARTHKVRSDERISRDLETRIVRNIEKRDCAN